MEKRQETAVSNIPKIENYLSPGQQLLSIFLDNHPPLTSPSLK